MSDIAIRQVLSQIRTLQAQATQRTAPPMAPLAAPSVKEGGFGQMLKQGIDSVSQSQQVARGLQESFAAGDRSVELADVMIAGAKAQVGFRAVAEVRNRMVSAYQDIMNMPL